MSSKFSKHYYSSNSSIKTTFPKANPKIIQYRDYKNFVEEAFRIELRDRLQKEVIINYSKFEQIFLQALNKHAPPKKKVLGANDKPYMTKKKVLGANDKPYMTKKKVLRANDKPYMTKKKVLRANDKPYMTKKKVLRANDKPYMTKKKVLGANDKPYMTKKKVLRANDKPYVTKIVRKAIMRRFGLENKYYRDKLPETGRAYKKQKNYTERLIKKRKKEIFFKFKYK